jgi:hypothetical protein
MFQFILLFEMAALPRYSAMAFGSVSYEVG